MLFCQWDQFLPAQSSFFIYPACSFCCITSFARELTTGSEGRVIFFIVFAQCLLPIYGIITFYQSSPKIKWELLLHLSTGSVVSYTQVKDEFFFFLRPLLFLSISPVLKLGPIRKNSSYNSQQEFCKWLLYASSFSGLVSVM